MSKTSHSPIASSTTEKFRKVIFFASFISNRLWRHNFFKRKSAQTSPFTLRRNYWIDNVYKKEAYPRYTAQSLENQAYLIFGECFKQKTEYFIHRFRNEESSKICPTTRWFNWFLKLLQPQRNLAHVKDWIFWLTHTEVLNDDPQISEDIGFSHQEGGVNRMIGSFDSSFFEALLNSAATKDPKRPNTYWNGSEYISNLTIFKNLWNLFLFFNFHCFDVTDYEYVYICFILINKKRLLLLSKMIVERLQQLFDSF